MVTSQDLLDELSQGALTGTAKARRLVVLGATGGIGLDCPPGP